MPAPTRTFGRRPTTGTLPTFSRSKARSPKLLPISFRPDSRLKKQRPCTRSRQLTWLPTTCTSRRWRLNEIGRVPSVAVGPKELNANWTSWIEQSVALDPRNILPVSELAAQYTVLRRYDDAVKTLDSALAWKPLDFSLGALRANVDLDWKADLRRWKDVITSEAAKNADPNDLITARLNLAFKERDYHGAERTLAAHGGAEFDDNGFFTPREWNQAIVARGLGDEKEANAAFLAARERAAAAVSERAEDGKALIVLAQIDAAL